MYAIEIKCYYIANVDSRRPFTLDSLLFRSVKKFILKKGFVIGEHNRIIMHHYSQKIVQIKAELYRTRILQIKKFIK